MAKAKDELVSGGMASVGQHLLLHQQILLTSSENLAAPDKGFYCYQYK